MRRLTVATMLAVLLVGCAPVPSGVRETPTTTQPSSGSREPDCARQFDDNDAGFQLCKRGDRRGDRPDSE